MSPANCPSTVLASAAISVYVQCAFRCEGVCEGVEVSPPGLGVYGTREAEKGAGRLQCGRVAVGIAHRLRGHHNAGPGPSHTGACRAFTPAAHGHADTVVCLMTACNATNGPASDRGQGLD